MIAVQLSDIQTHHYIIMLHIELCRHPILHVHLALKHE